MANLQALCGYFHVTLDYLANGTSNEEASMDKLLYLYNIMDEAGKNVLMAMAEVLVKYHEKETTESKQALLKQARYIASDGDYQGKTCTTNGPLQGERRMKKPIRKGEACWIEKRQRWQLSVQREKVRKCFVSSTPGRRGKHEAEAKADEWLANMSDKDKLD